MTDKREVIITVQGAVRAGKTAISQAIAEYLRTYGIQVTVFDEPDGVIVRPPELQGRIMNKLGEQIEVGIVTEQMSLGEVYNG